jgi:predicted acylesterase/phospholipase RssA
MIETICIGSGGLKGITFVSALNNLEKNNYLSLNNIKKYTGISVGSIICILLIVGYKLDEIIDIVINLDYNEIKPDISLDLIIENFGFDNGENIINFLKNLILKKINKNDDITFLELYNITNKEFYVATTNFSKNKEKIFNFKDTPNVSVFMAIRMSISIPIIFTPVLFENDYYVDGALTNYVCIPENANPDTTLLVYLNKRKTNILKSIKDIIMGSLYIMSEQIMNKNLEKYNCLKIDSNVELFFSPELENYTNITNLLILDGKCSAKIFLQKKFKNKIKELKQNIISKQNNLINDVLNEIINKIEINHENNYL